MIVKVFYVHWRAALFNKGQDFIFVNVVLIYIVDHALVYK